MFWLRRKEVVGNPALRPLNAVSSSPTFATAPPICQRAMLEMGDVMRWPCSTTTSITSSVSSATSHERTSYHHPWRKEASNICWWVR